MERWKYYFASQLLRYVLIQNQVSNCEAVDECCTSSVLSCPIFSFLLTIVLISNQIK